MAIREKFVPVLIDFIRVLAFDVPKVFFDSHPFYRAMKKARIQDNKVRRGLYNLQSRGIIEPDKNGYRFTEKGKRWAINSRRKYFRIRNKKWDGKWRIIMFDIPSVMEKQRKSLRYGLRLIGAYMVQKSVFVFPYPCDQEVGDWCNELGLSEYVEVITANHIGSKQVLAKEHFDL